LVCDLPALVDNLSAQTDADLVFLFPKRNNFIGGFEIALDPQDLILQPAQGYVA
jgi:hypothetical protein